MASLLYLRLPLNPNLDIQTILPPLAFKLFGYSSYETSLMYMVTSIQLKKKKKLEPKFKKKKFFFFFKLHLQVCGTVSIAIYVIVAFTTKWTSDIYLLTCGWIIHILGTTWFLIWLPHMAPGNHCQ